MLTTFFLHAPFPPPAFRLPLTVHRAGAGGQTLKLNWVWDISCFNSTFFHILSQPYTSRKHITDYWRWAKFPQIFTSNEYKSLKSAFFFPFLNSHMLPTSWTYLHIVKNIMVMNKKEILCNDSDEWRAEICGEERRDSETRENGRRGGWECVGGGWGGGVPRSCHPDILCFDGLAFIFMAVFLCCRGAVLKSSIFSWYYRTRGRMW